MLKILSLSIISGIFGRLGGREKDGSWYDIFSNTKARDIGCSLLVMVSLFLLFKFDKTLWLNYLIVFLLHFGFFTTYLDVVFNFDNHFISGLLIGLSIMPLNIIINNPILIIVRAIILGLIWGFLVFFLPEKVIIWRKDIAEEFLRYFSVIITLLII